MIIHILASVLALALGQVSRHLIRRLPEIIEEENAVKLLIPTLKKDFKLDVICSAVNLVIFNLLVYFLGMNFQVLMYMLVVSCLQVVFWIDYTMQLIPDTVQVLLWILGLINVVVAFFMSGVMSGINYIAGGLIGGGIFYLLGVVGKIAFKKESMGFGDVKLMIGVGLIFGIKATLTITLVSFFISAAISILLMIFRIKKMDSYIPFGPFIVIACIAVMFTGYAVYVNWFIALCTALSTFFTDLIYNISN